MPSCKLWQRRLLSNVIFIAVAGSLLSLAGMLKDLILTGTLGRVHNVLSVQMTTGRCIRCTLLWQKT